MRIALPVILSLALLSACRATTSENPTPLTGWSSSSSSVTSSSMMSSEMSSSASSAGVRTRTDLEQGFSIQYPADWTVQLNAVLPSVEGKKTGTTFTPPTTMGADTVLMQGVAYITKTGGTCSSPTNGHTVALNGNIFTHSATRDVGAGNLYIMDLYTIEHANSCFTFTLYQHRCNLGTYCAEGHRNAFDDTALKAAFDQMVATFHFLNT